MPNLSASLNNGTGVGTFSARADGTAGAPKQIAAGCTVGSSAAVWSPDSKRVLFSASCGKDEGQLWVSTLDGKRVANRKLAQLLGGYLFELSQWLANPSRVLVSSWKGPPGGTIYAVPVSRDGSSVTGTTQTITFGTGAERRASAASNGLIVFSEVSTKLQIWSVPIDGSGHGSGAPAQLIPGSHLRAPHLSRDGRKLAFPTYDWRLYCRDLSTAAEWEIPTAGIGSGTPLFSPDASRIIFFSDVGGWRGYVSEALISGGPPKRLWGNDQAGYYLWDWSPDGSTVLFLRSDQPNDHLNRVEEMDLKLLSMTTLLDDPEYATYQAHFSTDGRWVTFNAVKEGKSRVYCAPFRKALVPRSGWISITDGTSDDKPHFSYDGRLIFFTSARDGYTCIWAQRLGPDVRPVGVPFAVYHSHERRRSFADLPVSSFEITVGPRMIAFNRAEVAGNIWSLQPAGQR